MERRLEGKVVLVTGGGVRVGRAIAEGLGRQGASVAVHFHRSEAQAAQVASSLCVDGNRTGAFRADLTRAEEIRALVEQVERQLGPIAALVNSAAVFERGGFLETSEEALDRAFALNSKGAFLLTQAVVQRMLPRGGGDVVNVLDVGGVLNFWARHAAYCMTKAALAALTRCLALELAPHVRVNAVAPGVVVPPEGMPPQEQESLRQKVPQHRLCSAEELADAVNFLLVGPRHVTGQVLAVDGGASLARGGR